MMPQTKAKLERELEIAKTNAKDLRLSNRRLSKRLGDKELEFLAIKREIEQLKSILAKKDVNVFESVQAETVSHTHPDEQRWEGRGNSVAKEQHDTNTQRRESRLSLAQDQYFKIIQSSLHETEKEKEALRKACLEKDIKIYELEKEHMRILHENEVQHSKLEDYREERASLIQNYDYVSKSYRDLQAENIDIAGLKRKIAIFLNDVGFSKDDFIVESHHSVPKTPPSKDDLKRYDSTRSQVKPLMGRLMPAPEILQPDSPSPKTGSNTELAGSNDKEDIFDNRMDNNTIIVARKVKEVVPEAASQIDRVIATIGLPGTNIDEDEQTDVDIVDNGSNAEADEGTAPESETEDAASEYDPEMDWDAQTDSDRTTSSAGDSDYKP